MAVLLVLLQDCGALICSIRTLGAHILHANVNHLQPRLTQVRLDKAQGGSCEALSRSGMSNLGHRRPTYDACTA